MARLPNVRLIMANGPQAGAPLLHGPPDGEHPQSRLPPGALDRLCERLHTEPDPRASACRACHREIRAPNRIPGQRPGP